MGYLKTNDYRDYLMHHGIKGMKWGVRRYRNNDGSLTSAGRQRYESARRGMKFDSDGKMLIRDVDTKTTRRVKKDWNKMDDRSFRQKYQVSKEAYARRVEKHGDPYAKTLKSKADSKTPLGRVKNIAKGAAAAALLAGAGYGMYKLAESRAVRNATRSSFPETQNFVQTKNGPVYYPFGHILPVRGSTAGGNKASKADAAAKVAEIRSRARQVNGDTHSYNPAWQTARDAHNRRTQTWGKRKWNGSK